MSTVHSRKLRGIVNARKTTGKQPAKGTNETSATTTATTGPSKPRPKPTKTKKKTQKKQQAQPQESDDEPERSGVDEVDEDETDPSRISMPVMDLVDESLTEAWAIHPSHQMCIIFDVINPVRQFRKGMRDNQDNTPCPVYMPNPEEDLNAVETNGKRWPLMQYQPYLPDGYVPSSYTYQSVSLTAVAFTPAGSMTGSSLSPRLGF